jgi:hypothetical protein
MKKLIKYKLVLICNMIVIQVANAQPSPIVALNPSTNQWEAMYCDVNSLIVPNENPIVTVKENFQNFRPGQLEADKLETEVKYETTSLKLSSTTVVQYQGEFAGQAAAAASEAAKTTGSVSAKYSASTTNTNAYELQTSTVLPYVVSRDRLLFGLGDKLKKVQKGKYGSMWCTKWKWVYNVSTGGWGWVLSVLAAPGSIGGPSGEYVFNQTWGWRINVLRATEPMYVENNIWGFRFGVNGMRLYPGGNGTASSYIDLSFKPWGPSVYPLGSFTWGSEPRYAGPQYGFISCRDGFSKDGIAITTGYKSLNQFGVNFFNANGSGGALLGANGTSESLYVIESGNMSLSYSNRRWTVTQSFYTSKSGKTGQTALKNGHLIGYATDQQGIPEPPDN